MWLPMLLFSFSIVIAPTYSHATLLSIDGWEANDGRITRDTVTGLDWLDLVVTNDQSVNSIMTDGFAGLSTNGFRLATLQEVGNLFLNSGAVLTPGSNTPHLMQNYEPALNLMYLLGCTTCQWNDIPQPRDASDFIENAYTRGLVMSPTLGLQYGYAQAYLNHTGMIGLSGLDQMAYPASHNYHDGFSGVFLVRPTSEFDRLLPGSDPSPRISSVPEPSIMLLLSVGLAGGALWRSRQRLYSRSIETYRA